MCMYASKIITTTIYPTVATVVGLGFGWYKPIMEKGVGDYVTDTWHSSEYSGGDGMIGISSEWE